MTSFGILHFSNLSFIKSFGNPMSMFPILRQPFIDNRVLSMDRLIHTNYTSLWDGYPGSLLARTDSGILAEGLIGASHIELAKTTGKKTLCITC